MKIPKPSESHTSRFRSLLPAELTVKPMFGCHAGFIDGNMVCGTWAETIMVRLSREDAVELVDQGGEPFMPNGRKMGNYMLLPGKIVKDDAQVKLWIDRALAATRKLPPKAPKSKKK